MIPVCEPYLQGRELEYVTDCIKTNWISSGGQYLDKFEKEFAEYCGVKYGVTTTSGTTALHLALVALGIGKGDEVIIPTFTIASCAFAVLYTGAKPVFVDCEPEALNINPEKVVEKINKKTKAIMPVHIYGKPCEIDELWKLAIDYGLYVIEDAAEAHGAEYKGERVGCFGNVGCFSFYANKLAAMGEGGIVVTEEQWVADKMRELKNLAHSKEKRFLHKEIGFNYRLSNIQAAIGLAQLERIDDYILIRHGIAQQYDRELEDVKEITLLKEHRDYVKPVMWVYGLLVPNEQIRDGLIKYLAENEVQARTFFVPMHQQPVLKDYSSGEYPVADDVSARGLYLPSGTGLNSHEIEYVCRLIKEYMSKCT